MNSSFKITISFLTKSYVQLQNGVFALTLTLDACCTCEALVNAMMLTYQFCQILSFCISQKMGKKSQIQGHEQQFQGQEMLKATPWAVTHSQNKNQFYIGDIGDNGSRCLVVSLDPVEDKPLFQLHFLADCFPMDVDGTHTAGTPVIEHDVFL
jgi:hypothetical protein